MNTAAGHGAPAPAVLDASRSTASGSPTAGRVRLDRRDLLIAAILASFSGVMTWLDSRRLSHGSGAFFGSHNVWFESDMYRRFASMLFRTTNLTVNNKHPLFSLFMYPPTKLLLLARASELHAVFTILALGAAGWLALVFYLLRRIGCRRLDAVVFSGLAKMSAASLFWSPVPETFLPGSLTILAALTLVILDDRNQLGSAWYVAANVLSLSFSTTNWMAGLLATAVRWPWRRVAAIAAIAVLSLAALWTVERVAFPHVPPLVGDVDSNRQFLFDEVAGGPPQRLRALVVHSMVMPEIEWATRTIDGQTILSVNDSRAGSGSWLGPSAVAIWILLLALAGWANWSVGAARRVFPVLWLLTLGQLGLHLVYGDEMFLYTLHILPLLVLLVAVTSLTPARIMCVTLAAVLTVTAGVNNRRQLERASDAAQALLTPGPSR